MQMFWRSIRCMSYLCLPLLYYSQRCKDQTQHESGCCFCACYNYAIFLSVFTNLSCFSSYFLRNPSASSANFFILALSLAIVSRSSVGLPSFLEFSISSSMCFSFSLTMRFWVLISVLSSSISQSFLRMVPSRSMTRFRVTWYISLLSYSFTVFCSRSIILQAFCSYRLWDQAVTGWPIRWLSCFSFNQAARESSSSRRLDRSFSLRRSCLFSQQSPDYYSLCSLKGSGECFCLSVGLGEETGLRRDRLGYFQSYFYFRVDYSLSDIKGLQVIQKTHHPHCTSSQECLSDDYMYDFRKVSLRQSIFKISWLKCPQL